LQLSNRDEASKPREKFPLQSFSLAGALSELLREQERLLGRTLTASDLILYDLRAQKISDLIQHLDSHKGEKLAVRSLASRRFRGIDARAIGEQLNFWLHRIREWAADRVVPGRPQRTPSSLWKS
jgi:hypothetical protein